MTNTPKRIRIASIAPIKRGSFPMNLKAVTRYRQMLRDGHKAPPLLLAERLADGRWQLFDGRHRLRAAQLEGKKMIDVRMMITP